MWGYKFVMMIFALNMLYLSEFSTRLEEKNDQLVFGLFISGVFYSEEDNIEYS